MNALISPQLAISITFGVFIFIVVYAIFVPKNPRTRLSATGGQEENRNLPFLVRHADKALAVVSPFLPVGTLAVHGQLTTIEDSINRAKNPWRITPEQFALTQIGAAILGLAIGILISVPNMLFLPSTLSGAFSIAVIVLATYSGYAYPISAHDRIIKQRVESYKKSLKEVSLLIRMGVAASPIDVAVLNSIESMPESSAPREDFEQLEIEHGNGITFTASLHRLAKTAPSPGIASFFNALAEAVSSSNSEELLSSQLDLSREQFEDLVAKEISTVSLWTTAPFALSNLAIILLSVVPPMVYSFFNAL